MYQNQGNYMYYSMTDVSDPGINCWKGSQISELPNFRGDQTPLPMQC